MVLPAPSPREKKQTLQSKYGSTVAPLLLDSLMERDDYSTAHSGIKKSIEDLGANHITSATTLPIDDLEASLSWHEPATLAQLRTGSCHFLNNYQMRIGKVEDATCP